MPFNPAFSRALVSSLNRTAGWGRRPLGAVLPTRMHTRGLLPCHFANCFPFNAGYRVKMSSSSADAPTAASCTNTQQRRVTFQQQCHPLLQSCSNVHYSCMHPRTDSPYWCERPVQSVPHCIVAYKSVLLTAFGLSCTVQKPQAFTLLASDSTALPTTD